MTLTEAYRIGQEKLGLKKPLMDKALEVVDQMNPEKAHRPPLMLAFAIMGVAKATDPEELSSELTDALALVSKAEGLWRMEQKFGVH